MVQQRLGAALIGAGMIAPTHVAAISGAGVRLEAVVSRRPERAAHLAAHYAGPPPLFTADLSLVTQNPAVDMVVVATPPSVRVELISELAAAGKHILLEKPVARTVAEAEQVVQICARAGVTLGVLFQHRVRASSRAAARYLASGDLGALGHVEIAVPWWRDQSYYAELGRGTYARDGGGVLITQAIHTIDLALSMTGPVASVQAMTATTPLHDMEAEDLAVAGLRFASGAVGSFVASTATYPQRKESITLHCANASMCISRDALELHWRDGRRVVEPYTLADAPDTPAGVEPPIWHQGVIEDFVDAIQHGRAPIAQGQQALYAHRFIEAIEVSSRTGQRVDLAL